MSTPTYALADTLLGVDPAEWLANLRECGYSLRECAAELERATNARVHVSPETIRQWLRAIGA